MSPQVTVVDPSFLDGQWGGPGLRFRCAVFLATERGAGNHYKATRPRQTNHVVDGFLPVWIVFHGFAGDHDIERGVRSFVILPLAYDVHTLPFRNVEPDVFTIFEKRPYTAIDIQTPDFQDPLPLKVFGKKGFDMLDEFELFLVGHNLLQIFLK